MSKPKSRAPAAPVEEPVSEEPIAKETVPSALFPPLFPREKRYFIETWFPGRLHDVLSVINAEKLILHSIVLRPLTDQVLVIIERGDCLLADEEIETLIGMPSVK